MVSQAIPISTECRPLAISGVVLVSSGEPDQIPEAIFGESLLARAVRLMRCICSEVIVVSDHAEDELPGTRRVADSYRAAGPMGGIHAGLMHAARNEVLIISASLPLLSHDVMRFVGSYPSCENLILPVVAGTSQPLAARYGRSLIPSLEEVLGRVASTGDSSLASIADFLEHCQPRILDLELYFGPSVREQFGATHEALPRS